MEKPEVNRDGRSDLRAEMARVAGLLARQLGRLRQRGKSPAGEAVQGFVIEDGEAEGISADLIARWNSPSIEPTPVDPGRRATDEVRQIIHRKNDDESPPPLRHAVEAFELTAVEYDAVLLALSVELDGHFGRLIAYLNDHVGHTRPTIGLALELSAASPGGPVFSPLAFTQRPLVRDGLLELEGEGPVPGLALRITRDMATRLSAEILPEVLPEGFRHDAPQPGSLARLVLKDSLRVRLAAWSKSLRGPGPVAPLVLSGLSGSGRGTAARAALAELGWPLVSVEIPMDHPAERLRAARREVRWHGAPLLARVIPPAHGERADWPAFWTGLADLPAPLLIAATPELTEDLGAAAPVQPAVIQFPEPELGARAALWSAILPANVALPPTNLDQLAARFRFNAGRIHLAVRRAEANSSLADANGNSLTFEALVNACRELGSAGMGPLAQKLPQPYGWEELIVPPAVRSELELARTWVSHQRKVLDEWGFASRLPMGRGLTMLFSGPPGTGKTMAAQVLAREWGLDLYRVDLSRTVSKFIGETEKNLSCLFNEAHASGAVLFFDEADALFGKRSEVKDAHDRYANLEIGYLLQRMEEYEGVTMLASNRARDLDEAFVRRFHFMIDFPMPDEAHRLKIWQGMFPSAAERETDLDFRRLAKEFEMSGGEIKNTVLAGAYIAAGEERPIRMADLQRAVRREFVKSGRVLTGRGGSN